MVAESQVACIEQQVQDYREEDLEAWRQAQIVLGKICSPDIDRYNIQPLSQYERGPTKCLEDDLAVCLQKYIQAQALTEKTEMQIGQIARLADYFTRVLISLGHFPACAYTGIPQAVCRRSGIKHSSGGANGLC